MIMVKFFFFILMEVEITLSILFIKQDYNVSMTPVYNI